MEKRGQIQRVFLEKDWYSGIKHEKINTLLTARQSLRMEENE